MKRNKSLPILTFFILIVYTIVIQGCKKDSKDSTPAPTTTTTTIPFQGPQNPSFEEAGGNFGASWTDDGSCTTCYWRKTGTSFMPSQGVWYESIMFTSAVAGIHQDNVDLTHSSTMTFDYSFTSDTGSCFLSATIQILFTSNGTVTLWQQTIDKTSTLPMQELNKTITLPATTASGRLLIQGFVTTSTNCYPFATFSIDNIRLN